MTDLAAPGTITGDERDDMGIQRRLPQHVGFGVVADGAGGGADPRDAYRGALRLAEQYRDRLMDLDALVAAARAAGLDTPHPRGCDHLDRPSVFIVDGKMSDPDVMPDDWKGTIGELYMVRAPLGSVAFDALHTALHPTPQHCAPVR